MSNQLLIKIEKIEADNVTVYFNSERDGASGEETLSIGKSYTVPSHYVVFDGINYFYKICFDRIQPDDAG
ncbi:MAG: hypothetical protein J6S92_05435 [Oscillospiraceae bacterium]|nr:hypothetical protein [Oscillospiraceae bacterium]MBQ5338281.1 hypothetical protein [Oscillospiraceae bacterium]MBQ9906764.1 hypothetical protein [Oscillospiraceae bacterium]